MSIVPSVPNFLRIEKLCLLFLQSVYASRQKEGYELLRREDIDILFSNRQIIMLAFSPLSLSHVKITFEISPQALTLTVGLTVLVEVYLHSITSEKREFSTRNSRINIWKTSCPKAKETFVSGFLEFIVLMVNL